MEEKNNSTENDFLKELGISDPKENVWGDEPRKEGSEGAAEGGVPGEGKEPTAEELEKTTQEAKNRRDRRIEERLRKERETNIALNERLRTLSESREARDKDETGYSTIDRIWGNETPEAREAAEILRKNLEAAEERAYKRAITDFETKQREEREALAKEEDNVQQMLDDVEDSYPAADFSNREIRRGFLTLLEKVSPKDGSGNVSEYADPYTVWELYDSQRAKAQSKAKEYANRGMTRSEGAAANEKSIQEKETENYLKENDLI
ncbi:MAG: hypothetical protein KGI72_05340 [Patescibacteria group bacterium]|nr:hypothetical protein [Patescibacteria group bacterium]MDE2233084.1 hypothetical protein [Patescibacteria group bacterium]